MKFVWRCLIGSLQKRSSKSILGQVNMVSCFFSFGCGKFFLRALKNEHEYLMVLSFSAFLVLSFTFFGVLEYVLFLRLFYAVDLTLNSWSHYMWCASIFYYFWKCYCFTTITKFEKWGI